MAYYQAQDRSGHIFEFSEPSVGYQEPSRRRRVLAGPIVFLLLCAMVGLVVHSSFLSLSTEPTLAAANIADRSHPQGVRDPEKEQGLEDIEDNDSAKLPNAPPSKKDKEHRKAHHGTNLFTSFFPMSAASTAAAEEEDDRDEIVSSSSDSAHFMTCLETNCEVAMKTIAKAYPSGSELLQCLAASADGVTATTCWGASSPEEDSRNDEGQNLRICAICNECIPGTINANECNARSHTWTHTPRGATNTTNFSFKSEPPPPPNISAPRHTPLGKYEAEKHHRARPPITNTTERKKKVGRPWVPMMSGGRKNETDKNFVNDSMIIDPVGHVGVIPTLAFETTEFAVKSKHHQQQRQQRQKQSLPRDKKRSRETKTKNDVYHANNDDENSPPFWTKYMNGEGQGSGNNWGGQSGDNGVSNTGKYRGRTPPPPPPQGTPWDRYMSGQQGGANSFGATESFFAIPSSPASSSSFSSSAPHQASSSQQFNQEAAFPPMLAFQNMDDDDNDKEDIVAQPIVSYETTDLSLGPAQHTSVEEVPAPSPDPDGPVEPWSKYGASAGGEGGGGNPWDKSEDPQVAFDTTELAVTSSSSSSTSSTTKVDKKSHSHLSKKHDPFTHGSKHSSEPSIDHSTTTSTVRHHPATNKKPATTTTKTKSSTTTSSTPSDPTTRWAGYKPGGYQGQSTSYPGQQPGGSSPAQAPGPKSGHVIGGGGGVVPVYTDASKLDGSSSSQHTIAHKAAPLPPDAPHQHPTHDSSASTTKTGKSTKQPNEHDELTRCMQVTCNAQVGQAGLGAGKNALACLSKTETKAEAADCLGKEDPANPANELRTCMICHKCIEGKLKDPSVCAKEDSSWNNAGAPWLG